MKKIIYLILGVLLFIPTLVKADGAGPGIISYKATPKSSKGADIYRYDGNIGEKVKTGRKLAYGKVITITWEDEFVRVDEEDEDNEDVVKLSDLVPVEKNYKVNEKNLISPKEVLVIRKMEIKKGPAGGYDGTGKFIPVGAKIKIRFFQYYDKDEKKYLDEQSAWAYVEYNGTKGFIDTEKNIAFDGVYTTMITAEEDGKITDVEENNIIATIKPCTKFNAMIYERDTWAGGYYIEYKNIKGITDYFFPKMKTITFNPTIPVKVYDGIKYNDKNEFDSKVITTIPKGTTFTSDYYDIYDGTLKVYYEKDNIRGWIFEDISDEFLSDEDDLDEEDEEWWGNKALAELETRYGFTNPKDYNIVAVEKKDTDNSHNPITILKTPIKIDNGDDEEEDVEGQGDTGETPTPVDKSDAPKTDEKTGIKKFTHKIPMLVYYCLGAAVIVSLTAVVTVLLVNKKKKNISAEEPKEKVE